MTAAQTNLYFYEWGRVRRHYVANGIDPKQADAKRHELHVKALGVRKSSKDFTNADLDKVIAAFRAVSDDANLNAQLRQLDQPEERRRNMVNRCWAAVSSFIEGDDRAHQDDLCQRYLDGTAKRMCGCFFRDLDERRLGQVMGALERSARVRKAKAAAVEEAEGNPF